MTVITPEQAAESQRRIEVLQKQLLDSRKANRALAEELSREHEALVHWQRLAYERGREIVRLRLSLQ